MPDSIGQFVYFGQKSRMDRIFSRLPRGNLVRFFITGHRRGRYSGLETAHLPFGSHAYLYRLLPRAGPPEPLPQGAEKKHPPTGIGSQPSLGLK